MLLKMGSLKMFGSGGGWSILHFRKDIGDVAYTIGGCSFCNVSKGGEQKHMDFFAFMSLSGYGY